MAYATVDDMVARFGEAEVIRLSSRDGELTAGPNAATVQVALEDASAVIDSHLRARYLVPLSPVPREILRCCCILARHDLAQGGDRTPSKEMAAAREVELDWLRDMASSEGKLAAPAAPTASDARVADRPRFFGLGAADDAAPDALRSGW